VKLLPILLATAALAAPAQAPDLAVPFQRRQLPNGLTVFLLPRPGSERVSVRLASRGGTVLDPAGRSGSLAVAARTLSSGTLGEGPRPSARDLEAADRAWDAVQAERRFREAEGARAAYTLGSPTQDGGREAALRSAFEQALRPLPAPPRPGPATCLEIEGSHVIWGRDLPVRDLGAWCNALATGLKSLDLPTFYHHRAGLAEPAPEPALSRLEGLLRQLALPGSPAGRPALGWPAEAASLRREDARAVAERAFAPGSLALVVVGDLDWERLDPLLAASFGTLPPRATVAVAGEPPLPPADRRVFHDMDEEAAYMAAWRVPGADHPDHPALEVAAGILAGGRTGRSVTRLLEGAGLAKAVGACLDGTDQAQGNLLVLWAEARGERSASDLAPGLLGDVDRLRSQPPPRDQVDRVVARARAQRGLELEDPGRLATAFARAWARTGDGASYALGLERLAAVTPEAVTRAVKAHLPEKPAVQAIGQRPRKAALGDDTLDEDLGELLTRVMQREFPTDTMRVGEEVRSQLDQILGLPLEQKRKIRDELRKRLAEAPPAKETPR
jgi:predicted Zn-dependent peptidase